jgi:hypothetical protein
MKANRLLAFVMLGLTSAGMFTSCTTTGNPGEGGIFWSESKAKDRQMVLRQRLASEETSADASNRTSRDLQARTNRQEATNDRLRRDTANLDREIAGAQSSLASSPSTAIQQDFASVERSRKSLERNADSMTARQYQVEIQKLRNEVTVLTRQNEALQAGF